MNQKSGHSSRKKGQTISLGVGDDFAPCHLRGGVSREIDDREVAHRSREEEHRKWRSSGHRPRIAKIEWKDTGWAHDEAQGRTARVSQDCRLNSPRNFAPRFGPVF